tara:strand:- start:783 stop:1133 length:351 start_codon:yes stop_codon:yes gene_type:complete
MAFKMRGYSAFTKYKDLGKLKRFKKDPKFSRKRILFSTQTPSGMMTEYSAADDKTNTSIVYRKGLKKYTKDLDLEFNPTGNFRQLKRRDKRILKKEGSYLGRKKLKKFLSKNPNYK